MLVVVCGRPCVGKTAVSQALAAFLEAQGRTVIVINEESLGIRHAEGYKTLKAEAMTRSSLKSAVERKISRDVVVILDSMNYIKGYRYELYCISRAQSTTRVTLFVETPQEVAASWNIAAGSTPEASAVLGSSCDHSAEAPLESSGAPVPAPRYSAELFSGLWARFEPPDEANRWDSPLFRVDGDAEPSSFEDTFHAVALALFEGKRVKATSATTAVHLADTNYLHVLDKITQDVVAAVQAAVAMGASVGESVRIPKSKIPVLLSRKPTLPELSRIRRQFIKVNTMHPDDDLDGMTSLFVEYINKVLAT